MFARPELLLPLAFVVSALLIVAALVMLAISARQTRQTRQQVVPPHSKAATQWKRTTTRHMFSGATVATLDELTRPNPARQRQVRMYS